MLLPSASHGDLGDLLRFRLLLCGDDWKDYMRRMLGIMVQCVVGYDRLSLEICITGVRVGVELRIVATGYVNPDSVPLDEKVAGALHIDCELVHLTELHQLLLLETVPVVPANYAV